MITGEALYTHLSAPCRGDVLFTQQLDHIGQRLQQTERPYTIRPDAILHPRREFALNPDQPDCEQQRESRYQQNTQEDRDKLGQAAIPPGLHQTGSQGVDDVLAFSHNSYSLPAGSGPFQSVLTPGVDQRVGQQEDEEEPRPKAKKSS
jgi:hypothetical protein